MSEFWPDARAIRVDPTAVVEAGATLGDGSSVWGGAQIRTGATLGRECVVGRGAFIDAGVVVGDRCKIQNHALVYAPARLADGVFVGPAVVLTNDQYPRAVTGTGALKRADDWKPVAVDLRHGCSVGARAVCVAPVVVGEWAMVGAGAVVVDDVPAHALVVGVPARRIAWVGRSGRRLEPTGDATFECPVSGETYREVSGVLSIDD